MTGVESTKSGAEREHNLVLTFLEEAQQYGSDYAEQRLLQRLAMGLCQPAELGSAAGRVDQQIERQYRFYHWWYAVVIGMAVVALSLYLWGIASGHVPVRLRQVFCLIIPAIVIFIRLYSGYLRELDERRRLHRSEMAALYAFLARYS